MSNKSYSKKKNCGNCYFFNFTVFDGMKESYYGDCSDCYVWLGYCMCELNSPDFEHSLNFYMETKSNYHCEKFVHRKEIIQKIQQGFESMEWKNNQWVLYKEGMI